MLLTLARTLVADILQSEDADTEKSSRLRPADYDSLLRWFKTRIIPAAAKGEMIPDFLEYREHRKFDFSLCTATEGRVLFRTELGVLGLGPGSVAVYDHIRVMPGGNTHIVLRKYQGTEVKMPFWVEARTFTVVGDCYLNSYESGRLGGGGIEEPEWQGSLPRELLSMIDVFQGVENVRQAKGERIYLL